MHEDRTRLPIDIVKIEGGNFAGAQTELGQDHQNRIVPMTHCRRLITGIENLLDLLWRQESWKAGKSPAADRWHAIRQRRRNEALQMQIAQEGAYHHAHCFATVGGAIERMSLDITDDDLRGERCKPICAGRTDLPEKSKRQKLVASHRRVGEPSLFRQICREYIDNLLVLCTLRWRGDWY